MSLSLRVAAARSRPGARPDVSRKPTASAAPREPAAPAAGDALRPPSRVSGERGAALCDAAERHGPPAGGAGAQATETSQSHARQ